MAEGQDAYDASLVDERPRSSHLSRKDLRSLLIVLGVLTILLVPIYRYLKSQRDIHLCKQNLGQIIKAMGVYLEANNDRFPPAYVVGDKGEPQLFDGHPYSWMSLIHDAMNTRSSFRCPAASDEENVLNLHPEAGKAPFASSYGLYAPWSTWSSSMIANPDRAVLIAETANNGARETYDPLPFSHGIDGIVIGWDNSNFEPTKESNYVTRLAYPGSKGAKFTREGGGRHQAGIHFLFVSGRKSPLLDPRAARISWGESTTGQREEIIGSWSMR